MNDNALKSILDREGVTDSIREHLLDPVSLLDDQVDYGTNLMARAFGKSPRDFKAIYLVFVQLQQFVAHLDAVAVLLRQGCCLSANLQVRTLLENFITTNWILLKDTDNKIEYIFVANLRRRRQGQALAIPGSDEARKNPDAAQRISGRATPEQIAGVAQEIDRIDQLLAEPVRSGINASFEQSYAKRGHDPHWYQLCGAKSIRQIAMLCDRDKDYDYIYSPLSGVTHGGGVWNSVIFRSDAVEVTPVRRAESLILLARMASTYAIEVYRLILNEYRPDEIENFNRKYLTEWRERYRQMFDVKVEPQFTQI